MRRWLKQLFCRHEFYIDDIGSEDLMAWPCHKCRREFKEVSGLKVIGWRSKT